MYCTLYNVRPQAADTKNDIKRIYSRFNVERTELCNS